MRNNRSLDAEWRAMILQDGANTIWRCDVCDVGYVEYVRVVVMCVRL